MENSHRRPTLSHQMTLADRSSIRNLNLVPPEYVDDDDKKIAPAAGTRLLPENTTTTIRSILHDRDDESPAVETTFPAGRTLLDIIGSEESGSADAYKGMIGGRPQQKIRWKSFKDRIRIRRTGAAGAESDPDVTVSDVLTASVQPPAPVPGANSPRSAIVTEYDDAPAEEEERGRVQSVAAAGMVVEEAEPEKAQAQPVVSLMALLQAEGESIDMDDEDEAGDCEEDEEDEEGTEHTCCVCMVRHKGAAFIPCGHTFCRLCSRELWVSRGNCPLCNGYILEILDIF